jgi:hypothetical protein
MAMLAEKNSVPFEDPHEDDFDESKYEIEYVEVEVEEKSRGSRGPNTGAGA